MTAPLLTCPAIRSAGGIAAYARLVLDALAPGPVEVLGQGNDSEAFALPAHAQLLGSPIRQELYAARLAQLWLTRAPTTFVFAHVGLTAPLAVLPRRPHRVVLLAHGFEMWSRLGRRRSAGLGRVNSIVFTTRYTRELFRAWNTGLFAEATEMPVVPLSAGPHATAAGPVPAPVGGKRVVTCITRLTREEPLKGIPTLLAAAKHLDPAQYEIRIVGDGDARESLVAEAARLGVADRVRFLGWVSDAQKRTLLAETDAVVLPSAQEGFGIVFLEALALGRPCIGAAAGAIPEVLTGGLGETFPYADPEALAATIARVTERFRAGEPDPETIVHGYEARFGWQTFRDRWRAIVG